jgi:ABC-2 type transporter
MNLHQVRYVKRVVDFISNLTLFCGMWAHQYFCVGLDAFSAVQVCQVLKKVANAGSSVLFTIHQPSSEIFESFDRLILMQKGRVMYQGSVSIIPEQFKNLGFPVPPNYNPADWVINVAQNNPPSELETRGFFAKDSREIEEAFVPAEGQDMLGVTISGNRSKSEEENRHGIWVQTNLLVVRDIKFYYRFPAPLIARFGIAGTLAALVSIIYWGIGNQDPGDRFNLTSQLGAVMILMVFSIIGCAQPAIMFFPEERPIFLREFSTRHYKVLPYFMSRLCMEIIITFIQLLLINVIMYFCCKFKGTFRVYFAASYALALSSTALAVTLGVIARGNAKVSQQLLPVVMLPQFVFCGFFVSPKLVPRLLQWVTYICPLTYAVRIIAVEEFSDCGDNPLAQLNCNMLLLNLEANADDVWWYWIAIIALFVAFRLVALYLLRKNATTFY